MRYNSFDVIISLVRCFFLLLFLFLFEQYTVFALLSAIYFLSAYIQTAEKKIAAKQQQKRSTKEKPKKKMKRWIESLRQEIEEETTAQKETQAQLIADAMEFVFSVIFLWL